MKQPLQKLRRFFSRPKKFNATANPEALSAAYDDDDGASRLSGAFVIVLVLHIIALVGVFAFARIKDSRAAAKTNAVAETLEPDTNKKTVAPKQPTQGTGAAPATTPAPTKQVASIGSQVTAGVVAHSEPKVTTPEPVRAPVKGDRVHIVKAGDNLTKIANLHGVTIAELVKTNNLKIDDDLKINQELKVPEASRTPVRSVVDTKPKTPEPVAPANTYVVRKNDSLIKIANNLGVKYEELVKLNNIKDPKKLQEGQKLKVPRKG